MSENAQKILRLITIFVHYLENVCYNNKYKKILQRGDNVIKKEMIAMLLAGGQGSRLGVLTQKVAKPAVSFGGKYRIIDFPLSNCIN